MYVWYCTYHTFLLFFQLYRRDRSPAAATVWERLGVVSLLKNVCHWGQAWRFQKSHSQYVCLSLPPTFRLRCELSDTVPAPFLPACLQPSSPPRSIIYLELTDVFLIQLDVPPHPQFVKGTTQTFFFIGSGWRCINMINIFQERKKEKKKGTCYKITLFLSLKGKKVLGYIYNISFIWKVSPST